MFKRLKKIKPNLEFKKKVTIKKIKTTEPKNIVEQNKKQAYFYKKNISEKIKNLPENSFSRRLLKIYNENPSLIGNEIGLIKFNKKLFNVTISPGKESFILASPVVRKLSSEINLKNSSFIHTHIHFNKALRKNINPSFGDISSFIMLINHFNMSRFEISILNKNHLEIGRTFLLFDISKKESLLKNYLKIAENTKSPFFKKIVKEGFPQNLLNELGFKVRYVPMEGYKFTEKKKMFTEKQV